MKMSIKAGALVALLVVTCVTARPSGDEPKDDEAPRFTRTTSYHGANTRIDPHSDVGLEYYGGARGMVLTYHPVLGLTPGAAIRKEDEEDVGQETEPPPQKPPPGGSGDSVVISKPPPGASVAEARPVGLAIAGVGGTAASQPTGTAVVGPAGLAISRPVATAIAGVQLGEQVLSGITGNKPQTSDETELKKVAPHSYTSGTNQSPVVVAVAPGALQNLYYHVIPSESQGQSEGQMKAMDLRGIQYGHERPNQAATQRPPSHYQKPSGDRGPMYGYKPLQDSFQQVNLQRLSQDPFYTHGVRYAYPDLPIDITQMNPLAYSAKPEDAIDLGPVPSLAVGPNGENGKYGIVPLAKMGVQENKQPMASSYQIVTGGKPVVGFNQVVYPVAYY